MAREQKSARLVKKILVPTDGSPGALEAAKYAVELVRAFGAEVTLLHVVEVPRIPAYFLKTPGDELRQQFVDAGKSILALTQKIFSDVSIPANTDLLEGRPGDVIAMAAVQGQYDLIVVGSRGLDLSESHLMGSVSDHLAHYAPCPVLIVRSGRGGAAA